MNKTIFIDAVFHNWFIWIVISPGTHCSSISKGLGVVSKVWKMLDQDWCLSQIVDINYTLCCVHVCGMIMKVIDVISWYCRIKIVKLVVGDPPETKTDARYVKLNTLSVNKTKLYICTAAQLTYKYNRLPQLFWTCILLYAIAITTIHGICKLSIVCWFSGNNLCPKIKYPYAYVLFSQNNAVPLLCVLLTYINASTIYFVVIVTFENNMYE